MSDARSTATYRRLAFLLALGWVLAGALAEPGESLETLYERARAAFPQQGAPYRSAARALAERGEPAATFLAGKLAEQSVGVGKPEDIERVGIRVTIDLLSRMNSYPGARAALARARRHPVEQVGKWAQWALEAEPIVQPPTATRPTGTQPATTQPGGRSIVGDRIYVPGGDWFARPETDRPTLPKKITKAFVIEIREEIGIKTYDAVRRKVRRCKGAGAEIVIIDMDTPGGQVGAAIDIARMLMTELSDRYTVCYVRMNALSAGAMIALACDEIVMHPDGLLGAAAPLVPGQQLEPEVREKFESFLREDFARRAERNGYPVALAEGMVSNKREVWLIRNEITRELRYVLRKDWAGRVRVNFAMTDVVSNDRTNWELLRVVVPKGDLLTARTSKAIEYGLTSAVIDSPANDPLADLRKHYNIVDPPEVLQDNWSEGLVDFLTHPAVFGFLAFVALLCGYAEINTPGFGVPGFVAIVCVAILLSSSYLTGLANYVEIILLVIGLILLAVEIFVTPGFGLPGIAGILCIIGAIVAFLVPNAPGEFPIPTTALDWSYFTTGLMALCFAFVAALIGAAVLARYLPKVPLASRLLLDPPEPTRTAPVGEGAAILDIRPGQRGQVVQTCRPVGKVRIAGKLCDAIADGAFIERGADVVVLRHKGNRVVVEEKRV